MRPLRWLILLMVLGAAALLIYQIPAINSRLSWRVDAAQAYVRGVLNPVGSVPTPIADQTSVDTLRASLVQPSLEPAQPEATQTLLPSPTPLPQTINLGSPEWEKQDWNNCGPATLTMYLRTYGWVGNQFEISNLIKPERPDRNVNIEELLFYTSNYTGWLKSEFRVGGNIELLKQLLAVGIPVMIEEGDLLDESYWPDDDQWAGHYLLLTGYDDAVQSFVSQDSFRGADRQVSYSATDERWKAFNRAYFLVYHPNQEELVNAILGPNVDVDYNRGQALETAIAETEINPKDAFAWFNLGSNLVYFEKYAEAADAYNVARTLGLPQRMFRYQFGTFFAYFHANRMDDLLAVLDYSLQITPNSEESLVWMGWALYRQGDDTGAVASFREAYWQNTLSIDAQYALDFMGASP